MEKENTNMSQKEQFNSLLQQGRFIFSLPKIFTPSDTMEMVVGETDDETKNITWSSVKTSLANAQYSNVLGSLLDTDRFAIRRGAAGQTVSIDWNTFRGLLDQRYLQLTGGTVTGAVNFNISSRYPLGSGVRVNGNNDDGLLFPGSVPGRVTIGGTDSILIRPNGLNSPSNEITFGNDGSISTSNGNGNSSQWFLAYDRIIRLLANLSDYNTNDYPLGGLTNIRGSSSTANRPTDASNDTYGFEFQRLDVSSGNNSKIQFVTGSQTVGNDVFVRKAVRTGVPNYTWSDWKRLLTEDDLSLIMSQGAFNSTVEKIDPETTPSKAKTLANVATTSIISSIEVSKGKNANGDVINGFDPSQVFDIMPEAIKEVEIPSDGAEIQPVKSESTPENLPTKKTINVVDSELLIPELVLEVQKLKKENKELRSKLHIIDKAKPSSNIVHELKVENDEFRTQVKFMRDQIRNIELKLAQLK